MAASGLSCGMWGSFVVPGGLFVAAHRFLSSCDAQAPERAGSVVSAHGLSSCGAQALEHTGSVVVARKLSCPTACGILVSRPGIKPASPALKGGFLTTGPPGKSPQYDFQMKNLENQA